MGRPTEIQDNLGQVGAVRRAIQEILHPVGQNLHESVEVIHDAGRNALLAICAIRGYPATSCLLADCSRNFTLFRNTYCECFNHNRVGPHRTEAYVDQQLCQFFLAGRGRGSIPARLPCPYQQTECGRCRSGIHWTTSCQRSGRNGRLRYVARRRPFLSYRPQPTPSLAVRAFRGSPAIRVRSVTFAFVCSPALWSNKGERVGRRLPHRGASGAFLGRKLPVFRMPPPPTLHCRGFRSLPERNRLFWPRLPASRPTTCAGTLCERRTLPQARLVVPGLPMRRRRTSRARIDRAPPQANCPDRWPALIRTWILVRCVCTQQLCQALGDIATPAYLTTGKRPCAACQNERQGIRAGLARRQFEWQERRRIDGGAGFESCSLARWSLRSILWSPRPPLPFGPLPGRLGPY